MTLKDRGLTFATNPDRGLCIPYREPVPGIDPLHRRLGITDEGHGEQVAVLCHAMTGTHRDWRLVAP